MTIRVLLVDDHQIMRDGLKAMLSHELDMEVVGEADNGREALRLCAEVKPDVVVMDIAMADLNGIDATAQLRDMHPECRIVALSMHSERSHVSAMLAAGASAYLLKDGASEELSTAIRSVYSGTVYLPPSVAALVVDDYVRRMSGNADGADRGAWSLSPREREVLQLVASGNSTKEIASALDLSVKTVDAYRRQLMEKLQIYSVAGLVKYAVREGLASLDD